MRHVAALLAASFVGAVVVLAGAAPPRVEARTGSYRFRPILEVYTPLHVTAPRSAPGKLFVVQQDGLVRVAVNGRLQPKPFLDLRRLVAIGDEQGLLSIAFHPNYAANRRFYVDYTGTDGHTRVVEYRANSAGTTAVASTARRLLLVRQPGPRHNGGQLAFGPDRRLWVSLGDGECCDDPQNRAQDTSQLLGKLLRLDVDARVPTPQLAALGLRNPWRFSFDRANGDLYIGDVGAGLWEEVDYVPRAQVGQLTNFGWDAWEGRAVKEDKAPNPAGRLVFPIEVYDHEHDGSCSVTGGFVYRGSTVRAAVGRYFYGDYCSGVIWSLRVKGGVAGDVRREPFRVPGLSSFGEDSRGELYATSLGGQVYKLVP